LRLTRIYEDSIICDCTSARQESGVEISRGENHTISDLRSDVEYVHVPVADVEEAENADYKTEI